MKKVEKTNKTNKTNKTKKKVSALQRLIENNNVPMFVCFNPDKKQLVYIWEESPDRLKYRTDEGWHDVADCNLIWYRYPAQGQFVTKTQKAWIYASAADKMRHCKTKVSKANGEYIVELHFPVKEWIEYQEKAIRK
jgi:hypothetical protein